MPLLPPPEPFADPPPSVLASYGDADGGALAELPPMLAEGFEARRRVGRVINAHKNRPFVHGPAAFSGDGGTLVSNSEGGSARGSAVVGGTGRAGGTGRPAGLTAVMGCASYEDEEDWETGDDGGTSSPVT